MQRALDLAALGLGSVSPNPMVGCVIVHNEQIIGEGWHRKYGQAHAEVNAVEGVIKKYPDNYKTLLASSTVFVSLEPCSHFGKTPPCSDLLIEHGVRRVVICNHDPNPLVSGKGITKLQNAGIEIITGLLEAEGHELNRRFFAFIEQQRPYIILKWAQTADGFIAEKSGKPIAISNALSQALSHKWRTEEDAIMVGTNTAFNDNPQLNARHWVGRNPVRVVIDRSARLPQTLHLFDGSQQTIRYEKALDLPQIVQDLFEKKIQSLIVEGGAMLLQGFINQGLYDEIRVFKATKRAGEGIAAPILPNGLKLFEERILMSDSIQIMKP